MDIISMRELNKKMIEDIFERTKKIENNNYKEISGVLGCAFFEPSTRTKLSFQTAAQRIGVGVIDFVPETSSLKKGENFSDTIRMLDGYSNILVVRHPKEGSSRLAAKLAKNPVINCGDGGNEHPTQALVDLYTIKKEKKKIDGINITLFGDLKHARTIRSLVYGLAMFGANITLIAPKGLELDKEIMDEVKEKFNAKISIKNTVNFKDADVIYVVRIQEERFQDKYEAKKIKEEFKLKLSDLETAKKDVIVLHPLPKIDEINADIDRDKRAKYFEQAKNAVPLRMALIQYCLKGRR